jgi:hypothetical protein
LNDYEEKLLGTPDITPKVVVTPQLASELTNKAQEQLDDQELDDALPQTEE